LYGNFVGFPAARRANKNTLFLSFPQEVPLLHSIYTVRAQFPVAQLLLLPQGACSQKREIF
jgi:hypothetical protein